MSSTNKTATIELSQYIATDKPTYLVDYNGDMRKIDEAIASDREAISAAQSTADTADGKADANAAAISALDTEINDVTDGIVPKVNDLTGDVNTIQSLIGNGTPTTTDKTIIGAINELKEDIDDVDVTPEDDIIIISASYGSTPSAQVNCLVFLEELLSTKYNHIYTSTHGGDSFHDGSYLDQLQNVSVEDANKVRDIVVIGIGNDIETQEADLKAAIKTFTDYCKSAYPNAKVSIAPVSTRSDASQKQQLFNTYNNICYDLVTPNVSIMTDLFNILALNYATMMSDDGTHPTEIGARTIAMAIANKLITGAYSASHWYNVPGVITSDFTDGGHVIVILKTTGFCKITGGGVFTPTADVVLGPNWGQNDSNQVPLYTSPQIKTPAGSDGYDVVTGTLIDRTDGSAIPIGMFCKYHSGLNGFYYTMINRLGQNYTLVNGHTYRFEIDGMIPFSRV